MKDAFHRLASFLAHGTHNGICVLCQANYQGRRQWFCRLSRKVGEKDVRYAIQYGSDVEGTINGALDEIER